MAPAPRDAADRWNVENSISQVSHQSRAHQRTMASPADLADVRTCVAAEQREGTPLYQQYEDYVRSLRSSRRNSRRKPLSWRAEPYRF